MVLCLVVYTTVQADMPETWIMDETRRKFANMMSEFSADGNPLNAYIFWNGDKIVVIPLKRLKKKKISSCFNILVILQYRRVE